MKRHSKPSKEEVRKAREKAREESNKFIDERKGKMSKVPVLRRIENDKIAKEKGRQILEEAEEVYIPGKAREKAEEEKEHAGKTRIYQAEENGKKVAIVIPRFKEEYTAKRSEEEVFRGLKGIKGRVFRNKKQLKESLEEGEIGMSHTHPPGGDKGLSEYDKTQVEKTNSTELVVSPEGGEIGYNSKGKLKQKEAKFVDREKINELMKEEVKERAKRKGKKLLKKKK